MTYPEIAVTAVAAPLVVSLICLFAWQRFDGGRHLLYWAVGHACISISFVILGFLPWWDDSRFDLHLAAIAGNQAWAVTLAAGAWALTGRPITPWLTSLIVVGAILMALGLQQISDVMHYASSPLLSSLFTCFAAIVLLRAEGSIFFRFTGMLLLVRAALTLSLATDLVRVEMVLNSGLSVTAFMNLLTGLGLIMIEFDAARQREQENRLFFETLLESMPVTISYKDTNLRYRMMNRCMREMRINYSPDYLNKTWSEIAGSDVAAVVENLDRRVLATGETTSMEQAWNGPDGRPVVIWALKVPFRDPTGRIVGIITCGLDITKLKAAEAELIEQREAAEGASRAKSAFLSNMSHELRTPLNAIIGFAQMLSGGYAGQLNERQLGYAANVQESGEHLLRLVNDILDLSRLESGRLDIQIEACSFDQIAQSALAMVQPQARQAEIGLSYEPTGFALQADPRALIQILVNLLGNAVKFSQPQGTVYLEASIANGIARIRVRDTGAGMSEAESRAVTQPLHLHRIDVYRTRANSGAGLGLSICRSLIDLHGGRLEILSQPGKGTIVDVLLPA
jgi:PAS domain S-box-containing protein